MTSFMLSFFFFNDTATTAIYTLSLHDALPICGAEAAARARAAHRARGARIAGGRPADRGGARRRQIGRATSELQSHSDLVCRLLLEKKNTIDMNAATAVPVPSTITA